MSVAVGVRAGWLVFDWGDNAEHPFSAAIAIYAEPVRTVKPRHGLRLRMTSIAGLSAFIDSVADLGSVRRVADSAVFIEDADLHHAGLLGDGPHDVIHALATVAQHVVGGTTLDHITDAFRAQERGRLQVLTVEPNVQISKQRENNNHGGQ